MREIGKLNNINQILTYGKTPIFSEWGNKNLWIFNDVGFEKIYEGSFYTGITFGGIFYFVKKSGESVFIINNNKFEISEYLKGSWHINPYVAKSIPNVMQISRQIDDEYFYFLLNLNGDFTKRKKIYKLGVGSEIVINNDHTNIFTYSNQDEKLIWQIDTSTYGFVKEPTDDGFEELPNKIDRPIFCDHSTLYVPMKGGQLIALNASDGSLKWMLEMEVSCTYEIFESKIYANNGDELFEIEARNGSILKSITYKSFKKLKGLFGITGEFRVYDEYVILRDQSRGWVLMFDRQNFSLVHMAETGQRLGSDASHFHWLKYKLYVHCHRDNTLHIYEPEK